MLLLPVPKLKVVQKFSISSLGYSKYTSHDTTVSLQYRHYTPGTKDVFESLDVSGLLLQS